jgi:hypothetical protein
MKTEPFSDVQQSILIGSLLGDGHLTKPRSQYGGSAFVKNQCNAHLEYLQWHLQQFNSFPCSIHPGQTMVNDKSYQRNTFYLGVSPFLSTLRKSWYPNGIKTIPPDIQLTPLSIAIWYFDDGSNILKARRASFATYCFSRIELERLTSILHHQYQIACTINSKNVINIRASSYKRLIDIVTPFMLWDCFQHKISYRDSQAGPSCKPNIDQVVLWYQDGKTVQWIANNLGVGVASIYNQLHREIRKPVCVVPHTSHTRLAINNTSGFKGVCFDKSRNKWKAYLKIDGKRINLGRFSSQQEANKRIQDGIASHSPVLCSNTYN